MLKNEKNWYVYIIVSSDESLYTGITTDLERRFQQHLSCKGGARYFHGRRPKKIVYLEHGHDRSSASKREAEIKSLNRSQKISMISDTKN
jgi:putative endonuclease